MRSQISFIETLLVAVALAGVLSLSGCNKGSGANSADGGPIAPGNPQIADVPSPTINGCFQNAGANPSTTNTWWNQYNVQPYPMNGYGGQNYQNSFGQGFCGCPAGTMPTCSGQGLLCMPVQHMNWNVATWSWNGQNQGGGQFNPQYSCVNPNAAYTRYHRRGGGPRSNGGRGFFYQYSYTTHTEWGPGADPRGQQQPQPVGASNGGGTCTGSVAQLCTPNPAIPTTPGQMYCQPLQPGNFSGPGVWVRL